MATTTNFGWETPDDTDLVKDGAAAMRTLGNSIDTSLVDLKGGTTGQVLSKASNTDMDFTWVAQDDSNAIQNAIVDAKGDIITATAADTPARLAVGSSGNLLVADSSTSTGLAYAPTVFAGKNFAINGNFDIWQRGTSFVYSSGTPYTADRWLLNGGASVTVSRESTSAPAGSIYYLRETFTGASGYVDLTQLLESSMVAPLVGNQVTFSIQLKRNSTFNVQTRIAIDKSSTTDAGVGATWSNIANTIITATDISTSAWTTFKVTATIPSDGTANSIRIKHYYDANPANGSTLDFSKAQLEIGSSVTNFARAGGTIQGELAAAQRYYESWTAGGANYGLPGAVVWTSATAAKMQVNFAVPKRVAPSVTFANVYTTSGGAAVTPTAMAFYGNSTASGVIGGNTNITSASGGTNGYAGYVVDSGAGTGYINWSAEL